MKLFITTILKLAWGSFLLITSLYCLLAFLPYTYHAFIHAPPYVWMLWFVRYYAPLYWMALACAALGFWPEEIRPMYALVIGAQAAVGIYMLFRPIIPNLRNDRSSLIWGVAALVPVVLLSAGEAARAFSGMRRENLRDFQFEYRPLAYAAVITAVVYFLGGKIQIFAAHKTFSVPDSELVLLVWSAVSLLFIGVVAISLLNVIGIVAMRTPRARVARIVLVALTVALILRYLFLTLCSEALSFEGPAAQVYCSTLAAALILFTLAQVLPVIKSQRDIAGESTIMYVNRPLHLGTYIFASALCAAALALPAAMNGHDWNDILQHGFAIAFWVLFTGAIYALRPKRVNHSLLYVVAVVLAAGLVLKGLQASQIIWGRPIGKTDDDIERALETYGTQDASFDLANRMLGKTFSEPCGELCRIMRRYTNIPDARAEVDVKLVDPLTPATGEKPNIFIFVIDSMRPDYLGAYNPKVAFTPNLDALAKDKDSVALRNVYTQYAGTALSEPAIWSGALLLHAHWMQPFSRVNSLEKLARADGYKMLVSKDTVLTQILDPGDDLVNVDADKKTWNEFETCSTVQNTMAKIDAGAAQGKPIFFFSQPMNVHQFARNNQPRGEASGFRPPVELGFVSRIATEVHQVDSCLGTFFDYLRKKGMWENSIIVVTADHGDATGELGRISHSVFIYPEIMRVPLIIHLPPKMRAASVYDDSQVGSLLDVAPSIYYLLGHRPIVANPLFGRPIFVEKPEEWQAYPRKELFLASDSRAVYGILEDNGRYLYATYDWPARSMLFDLQTDPNAQHNIVTPEKKRQYDVRVIEHLQRIAKFYRFQP